MAQLYKYMVGDVAGDEEELTIVVNDFINKGFDQIDMATMNCLVGVDERASYKRLLGQPFYKQRVTDDYVEFRGWITAVNIASNDKFNLVLKAQAKTKRLNELASQTNCQVMGKSPLTAVESTPHKLLDSSDDYTDYPAYGDAGDHAVMIVPGESASKTRELAEARSASEDCTLTGEFGDVNDDDDSAGIMAKEGESVADLWLQVDGSSATAKASVIGANVRILCNAMIPILYTVTLKLQYYNNNTELWTDIATTPLPGGLLQSLFGTLWTSRINLEGYVDTNEILDEYDDWKVRLIGVNSSNQPTYIRILSLNLDIYTDAKYNGVYFPISSYDNGMLVSVDPVAAGVDIGDTYVVGQKDYDSLVGIFAEFTKIQLPFTCTVDANISGYTARNFADLDLMTIITYFCEKHNAHWWYDHHNDTFKIYKETTLATEGSLREPTEADFDTYGLDDKIDTQVKSVEVKGATYRNGQEDEIVVTYLYPSIPTDTPIPNSSHKELIKDNPDITSWTEARFYAKGIYERRNSPQLSIPLYPCATQTWILNDRITTTIDGIVITNESITTIDESYDVGNNHVTQIFKVGFQQTTGEKRVAESINNLRRQVSELNRFTRDIRNSGHPLIRNDFSNFEGAVPIGHIPVDLIDHDALNNFEEAEHYPQGEIVEVGTILTGLWQGTAINATYIGVLSTSKITSGEFADARIKASNVTQHQLAITALGTLTTQLDLSGVDLVITGANISCVTGSFSATSVNIGTGNLSETSNNLIWSNNQPSIIIKDANNNYTEDCYALIAGWDENNVALWSMGINRVVEGDDLFIINFLAGDILLETDGGDVVLGGDTVPESNNALDLGSDALEWKDLWIDGIAYIDSLVLASGATITAFDNTPLAGSVTKVPTNTTVKVYVDKHDFTLETNKVKVPLIGVPSFDPTGHGNFIPGGGEWTNTITGSLVMTFWCGLPTTRGGLKLYFDTLYLAINDADGSNYVTQIRIFGVNQASSTTLYDNGTDRTTANEFNYGTGNIDCSGYEQIMVYVNCTTNTQYALDISYVSMAFWYA